MTKETPVTHVRVGAAEVTIWKNTARDGSVHYNASLGRRYRDENGDPQSSGSFGVRDLLPLMKAADLAHTKVMELMDRDYEASKQPDQPHAANAASTTAGHQR